MHVRQKRLQRRDAQLIAFRCRTQAGEQRQDLVLLRQQVERRKLERLCHYVARPAVALERLSRDGDGLVVYELKHPFRDGTTHVLFEPLDFMARLAALVPRPRTHLVRLHGLFAPNARHRRLVVPAPAPEPAHEDAETTRSQTRSAMTWAQRLRRVFAIDISRCPRCGAPLYGDVHLDGLRTAATYIWPGAVHEGNGEMQLIIDERATPEQREALQKIMTGQDTNEMATMWWVFSAMCPTKHETLFKPIEIAVDVEGRRGQVVVRDVFETTAEPIKNPVTGADHRVRIDLPHGFEYSIAEIGAGTTRSQGVIALDKAKNSYAQFAEFHLSNEGVVRATA